MKNESITENKLCETPEEVLDVLEATYCYEDDNNSAIYHAAFQKGLAMVPSLSFKNAAELVCQLGVYAQTAGLREAANDALSGHAYAEIRLNNSRVFSAADMRTSTHPQHN